MKAPQKAPQKGGGKFEKRKRPVASRARRGLQSTVPRHKVCVRHVPSEGFEGFQGLVEALCGDGGLCFVRKSEEAKKSGEDGSNDDDDVNFGGRAATSASTHASAEIFYFNPCRKSKKRGVIPGVGYLVISPPTSVVSAEMLQASSSSTKQKALVAKATPFLDDAVKSLTASGVKLGLRVEMAQNQKIWKRVEWTPEQDTLEDYPEYKEFLEAFKNGGKKPVTAATDSAAAAAPTAPSDAAPPPPPVPSLVKFLKDKAAQEEQAKADKARKRKEKAKKLQAKTNRKKSDSAGKKKSTRSAKKAARSKNWGEEQRNKKTKTKTKKKKDDDRKKGIESGSKEKEKNVKKKMVIDPNSMSRN